jgi:hypothetical protein
MAHIFFLKSWWTEQVIIQLVVMFENENLLIQGGAPLFEKHPHGHKIQHKIIL